MKPLARKKLLPTDVADDEFVVNSRTHILDCAAYLFRANGYAATSLRDIGQAAGMRAASLYHHFPSKDAIVVEVLNRGVLSVFNEVRRCVEALGERPSFESAITAAITAHLRSLLELHDYTSANTRIYGQIPESLRSRTRAPRAQYERYWSALLERYAKRGALHARTDLHLLRLFLFGAMNGTLEWYQPSGGQTVERIAAELAALVLRAAGARVKQHSA